MQITQVVPGLAAGVGIDLAPDGRSAYYVEWSIGELSLVDTSSGAVETILTGLAYPEDVEVDWDNGDIFVSERTGSVVRVFPREGRKAIATPGGAPQQLALRKKGPQRFIYTVGYDSGELVRIDPDAGVMTTLAAGLGHPVGIVVDDGQGFAFVTEQDAGSLTQVELSTGAKKRLATGLVAPFFLAWNRDASAIYCVERDPANSLVQIDLATYTVDLVAAGLAWRPSGVAPNADDSLIYVCADRELEVISWNGGPNVKPPPAPFEIETLAFSFDGSAALGLVHHTTNTPVQVPEWVRANRSEPAAFVSGALPRVKVVLRKLAGYVPGPYAIGATGNFGGIRRRSVTPAFGASGLSAPIDFEFMWPLPVLVEKPDISLDWTARRLTAPAVPAAIGATVHRVYVPLARPVAPWNPPYWVEAFELACNWADWATTLDDAAASITYRYNICGVVSYDTVHGATAYGLSTFNFTEMLDRLTGGPGLGGKVNCTDSADTVTTIANLLGCELWESRMGYSFDLNPIIAIGYNTWAVPFNGGFRYHEVAWKGAATELDNVFDGCLKVDGDADPTSAPHTPLLPTNMLFGDCTTLNYRLRLSPPTQSGCASCVAQSGATRQRRPIS